MYNPRKNSVEKNVRQAVIEMSWEYLRDNFHKFSPSNKVRVALELAKKDMPTEIQGELKVVEMPSIALNGRSREYVFG